MIYITPSRLKEYFRTALLSCCLVALGNAPMTLASTYDVTATVPAPLPTQPAVITFPSDQYHTTTDNIRVTGTCSNDTAYVELYRNDVFASASPCVMQEFTTALSLLPNANTLQAKPVNSTGNLGPFAPPVVIYYDISETPRSPLEAGTFPSPLFAPPSFVPSSAQPLLITATQSYIPHRPGERVSWPVVISGGSPPYTLSIRWGDGQTITQDAGRTTTIEHVYVAPGTYTVLVEVRDSQNNTAHLQLVATIQGDAHVATDNPSPQPPPQEAPWVAPAKIAAVTTVVAAPVIFGRRIITRLLRTIFKR